MFRVRAEVSNTSEKQSFTCDKRRRWECWGAPADTDLTLAGSHPAQDCKPAHRWNGLGFLTTLQVFQAPPPDIVEVIPVHPLPGDGLSIPQSCGQCPLPAVRPGARRPGPCRSFGAPGLLPGLHHFDDLTLAGGVLFVVIQSFITPLVYIILNAFWRGKMGRKLGLSHSHLPPVSHAVDGQVSRYPLRRKACIIDHVGN